jgi:DNA-binding NarL/FixJ family response regulator
VIRVLVVDDQALVRAGFAMILGAQDDLEVVGEAADGLEALALVRETTPDVVLMDVRMPRMDGLETLRALQRESRVPRVLMLTTFDLDEYVYEAMRAGAAGFMLKDVPREQLIGAVRSVAAGDALLAPAITRRLIEEFVRRPAPSAAGTPEALRDLTERELDVMRRVAQGLSNAEIAGVLHLSEATVRTHISHILAKLDLRDRVQVVVAAYECGLVRPGSGD